MNDHGCHCACDDCTDDPRPPAPGYDIAACPNGGGYDALLDGVVIGHFDHDDDASAWCRVHARIVASEVAS